MKGKAVAVAVAVFHVEGENQHLALFHFELCQMVNRALFVDLPEFQWENLTGQVLAGSLN